MMPPFSASNDKRGFSLLEMLIVVAMISILTAVATTSIKDNLPQYRLSGAARRVMTDLMLARMTAVSKNTDQSVTFTSTGYTGGVAANIASEFKGVTLSTGGVTFDPRGMATAFTVTLSNGALPAKIVDVSTAGRIRVR